MSCLAPRLPVPGPLLSPPKNLLSRIEGALQLAFATTSVGPGCPPLLAEAQRHALFPGGARLRPQLCLVSALANGDPRPALSNGVAVALEFLHCASLVHDDLPCFDDAATRRGRPTVHKAFGEPLAVLVGDALIAQSFEVLVRAAQSRPSDLGALVAMLAEAVGTRRGLLAGQAWESEPCAPLEEYQRAKTAALFEAAAAMGALAAGADPEPWRSFGEAVGRAYQVADDLRDALGDPAVLGKPVGRDAALGRPSVPQAIGLEGARARLGALIAAADATVPACAGQAGVRAWLGAFASSLG